MDKFKKATLESLLDRKMQKDQGNTGIKEVEIKSLGMTLTVVKQPLSSVSGILDDLQGNDIKFSAMLDIYKQLIYLCVPLFHDTKLQTAYNCVEPFDVVTAVLDENIGAITKLAEAILDMYGLQDIVDNLKN